jgi:A/G-specific adenine glycosylase
MKEKVNVNQLLDAFPLETIRQSILEWWFFSGQRHFPWRDTHDPFKILIAEILLHRTRAEQVVPLYRIFFEKYPDIHSITQSSPDELAKSLRSAGLNWRWRLLHAMSVDIETRFDGQIPRDFGDLTSLPGVSHYIASSLRCFAFGYPDVLLDTNTVRVSGRILGLPITDSSRRSVLFREILERLMDTAQCRDFNFALIDFAAKVCRPKPIHEQCPIKGNCKFYNLNELKFEGILKNG